MRIEPLSPKMGRSTVFVGILAVLAAGASANMDGLCARQSHSGKDATANAARKAHHSSGMMLAQSITPVAASTNVMPATHGTNRDVGTASDGNIQLARLMRVMNDPALSSEVAQLSKLELQLTKDGHPAMVALTTKAPHTSCSLLEKRIRQESFADLSLSKPTRINVRLLDTKLR